MRHRDGVTRGRASALNRTSRCTSWGGRTTQAIRAKVQCQAESSEVVEARTGARRFHARRGLRTRDLSLKTIVVDESRQPNGRRRHSSIFAPDHPHGISYCESLRGLSWIEDRHGSRGNRQFISLRRALILAQNVRNTSACSSTRPECFRIEWCDSGEATEAKKFRLLSGRNSIREKHKHEDCCGRRGS